VTVRVRAGTTSSARTPRFRPAAPGAPAQAPSLPAHHAACPLEGVDHHDHSRRANYDHRDGHTDPRRTDDVGRRPPRSGAPRPCRPLSRPAAADRATPRRPPHSCCANANTCGRSSRSATGRRCPSGRHGHGRDRPGSPPSRGQQRLCEGREGPGSTYRSLPIWSAPPRWLRHLSSHIAHRDRAVDTAPTWRIS
jgi:hypothetical protein